MSERKSREQVPDEEVWACVAAIHSSPFRFFVFYFFLFPPACCFFVFFLFLPSSAFLSTLPITGHRRVLFRVQRLYSTLAKPARQTSKHETTQSFVKLERSARATRPRASFLSWNILPLRYHIVEGHLE